MTETKEAGMKNMFHKNSKSRVIIKEMLLVIATMISQHYDRTKNNRN